jgi:hypothetical protein
MRTLPAILALCLLPSAQEARAPLFVPGPPLDVGPGSGTLLFGDVNRDGRVDLLTRHLLTNRVTVQLGDGRGGFRPAGSSPLTFSYRPGDMALADLNKDGVPDLVVTPGDRDVLDVLVGSGSGGFTRTPASPYTVTTAVEPFNKRTLHLVDVNEDGNLDAVTANGRQRTSFAVMFGDGRAAFTRGPVVELDPGRDGYAFDFGDVDGDGHLDVVNASRAGYEDKDPGRVIVLRGDGTGAFRRASPAPLAVPAGPRWVQLSDVNGDRRADAAIAHPGGLISLLLNDGRGAFAAASPVRLGGETHFFRIADLNGDGRADLVAPTVHSVSVLLGDGHAFTPAAGSPFRAGPGAYNVAIGDVNADGRPDLAASSFEGNAVKLLFGQ